MSNEAAPVIHSFIVFDTCTHPSYYGDVHELLARPNDSIIRYEYKRYLWHPEAAEAFDRLVASRTAPSVDVLHIYGEKLDFHKGQDGDPETMLTWEDSVFVPIRRAKIVNVSNPHRKDSNNDPRDDKLHFHLLLGDFVAPETPVLEPLITALEVQNALPFGDPETQHSWIALTPESVQDDLKAIFSSEGGSWTSVVDRFVTAETQFAEDVFWRITSIEDVSKTPAVPVERGDRSKNELGHWERWHRDFIIYELGRYEISVETHSPEAHGISLPGDATLGLTAADDDHELLRIPAKPLKLVPNQLDKLRFSVATDEIMTEKHVSVMLETQVPNRGSVYPPGSMAELTFEIRKETGRYVLGAILALTAAVLVGLGVAFRTDPGVVIPAGAATVVVTAAAYFAVTGRLRFIK